MVKKHAGPAEQGSQKAGDAIVSPLREPAKPVHCFFLHTAESDVFSKIRVCAAEQ